MAEVLTPGERQLVADHLRGYGSRCARLVAIEVTLVGAGVAAGLILGTLIGEATYAMQRLRSRSVPHGPA